MTRISPETPEEVPGAAGQGLTEKPEGAAGVEHQGLQAEMLWRQLEVGLRPTRASRRGRYPQPQHCERTEGLGADSGQALGRETLQHL